MSDTETEVDTSTTDAHLEDIFTAGNENATITEEPLDESQGLQTEAEGSEEAATEEPQETNDAMSELRSQLEALETQLNEQKKQNTNAQNLIDRQGNELGQLRNVESKPELSSDEFLNKFADNPVEAQKELLQAELDKRESAKADQQHQLVQNRTTVLNLVPEFESKMGGIRDWYKEKGASDEFVNSLTTDSLVGNVDLAVALGEIQSLKGQLAETKTKTTNVIDKLNKGGAVVSAKSGQSASSDSTIQIPSNISTLSDKQLEKMLASA